MNLLEKKTILDIRLGDETKKEMTVMFADIRDWTTLSESMSPQSHLKEPDRYKHRFIDKVLVKERKQPVSVYEIFDGDPLPVIELKAQTKEIFENGLSLYYEKKFSEASVQFNKVTEKIRTTRPPASTSNAPPTTW